jgi:glutaredoxin 3
MNLVKIYTTGTCPYCHAAKQLLVSKGVALSTIDEIRVDLDPEALVRMQELTKKRTVPQIFIGSTYVGGHDDLVALDQAGGLTPLLKT